MRLGLGVMMTSLVFGGLGTVSVRAEDLSYTLVLQDHRFQPSQLEIPAGQKVRLVIQNLDTVTEEFDSPDLHREKLVAPGTTGVMMIGPLNPGRYNFTGEFHAETAAGLLVVK